MHISDFQIFTSQTLDLDNPIQFRPRFIASSINCKDSQYPDKSSSIGRIFIRTFQERNPDHDAGTPNVHQWR